MSKKILFLWVAFLTGTLTALPLPVEHWEAINYKNVKKSPGLFLGTTVFVRRKTTPFLFSPVFKHQGSCRFEFEMRSKRSGIGRLFYRFGNQKFNDQNRIDYKVDGSGNWKKYTFNIPANKEPLTRFRLDALFADAIDLEIRNTKLLPPPAPRLALLPSKDRFRGRASIVAAAKGEEIVFKSGQKREISLPEILINFPSDAGLYRADLIVEGAMPRGSQLELIPFDANHKPFPPLTLPLPADNFKLPANTAGIKAKLQIPADAEDVTIKGLKIEPVRTKGDQFGHWPAKWIWPGGKKYESDTALFQKSFALPGKPERAILQINADDIVEKIEINGKKLLPGPNAKSVFAMDEHEIASLLKKGKNTIFIAARNIGGSRGLMAVITAYYPGKAPVRITTDDSFQAKIANSSWEKAAVQKDPFPLRSAEYRYIGSTPPEHIDRVPRYRKAGLPRCRIYYGANNVPLMEVDGKTQTLNHLWGERSELWLINARNAGIHQYWMSGINFSPLGNGKYDWKVLDEICKKVISIDPEAFLILEIPVGTSIYENRNMAQWNEKHPDELVMDEQGNTKLFIFQNKIKTSAASFASKLWLKEARNIMRSAVEHVKKSPYAGHVAGFFPLAGLGHEWQYYGAHNRLLVDYSRPFREGFAAYRLKRRGPGADVTMPGKAEREQLIPSEKVRDMRDYFSELVSDVLISLAQEVKKASGGRSLFGTYYGYPLYVARPDWNETGGFMTEKLLNSPHVDFLVSLFRYDNRHLGKESGVMMPAGSYHLKNKGVVVQADHRTHLAVRNTFGEPENISGSIEVIKREWAWLLTQGAGFEFGYFNHGWIAGDPRLMQVVAAGQKLAEKLAVSSPAVPVRKVALIFDEEAVRADSQRASKHFLSRQQLKVLPHAGFAFDLFFKGIIPEDMKNYPLVVCMNFTDDKWAAPLRTAGCKVLTMPLKKPLTAVQWQKLAQQNGVHIYNANTLDTTLAGNGVTAIHTVTGGSREIRVPAGIKAVREHYSGKTYPVKAGKFTVAVEPLRTYLWTEKND